MGTVGDWGNGGFGVFGKLNKEIGSWVFEGLKIG